MLVTDLVLEIRHVLDHHSGSMLVVQIPGPLNQ
jgi:hypothetical protein